VAAPGAASGRDLVESFWALEISGGVSDRSGAPAPAGIAGGAPSASLLLPPGPQRAAPVLRVSDRGWITEPDDPDGPNITWPARLLSPPVLALSTPIYPDEQRRADTTAGEVTLANGDGALDALAPGWSLVGQRVILRRGPVRRPYHARAAEVGRVAEFRVAPSPLVGTGRLRLTLRSAAADLDVPVCRTYDGTGDAEGPASLTGQNKPRLYGIRRSIEPVQVDPGRLIYQIHDGRMHSVLAVRDRGGPLDYAGDVGSYDLLRGLSVDDATYWTCLATGHIRLGSSPSLVTVAARGDAEAATYGYSARPDRLAIKLLRGPGGLDEDRAPLEAFASWPVGDAGLWVTGGTVGAAVERLAAGIGAVWGTDAFGRMYGRYLDTPEAQGASVLIEPWMHQVPPQEDTGARAPWWRARVAWQVLDRVLAGQDLLGSLPEADKAYLGQAQRIAPPSIDLGLYGAFPGAEDAAVLESLFDAEADAKALSDRLLSLFGRSRRHWRVKLRAGTRGITPEMVLPGTVLSVTWPGLSALAAGAQLMVRSLDATGDNLDLVCWG
jgi:hypothetical protein